MEEVLCMHICVYRILGSNDRKVLSSSSEFVKYNEEFYRHLDASMQKEKKMDKISPLRWRRRRTGMIEEVSGSERMAAKCF